MLHNPTFILAYLTIKKLKSIDIINVLSDLVSEKNGCNCQTPATGHPVMGDSKYGDFEWNKEVKKKFHLNHQFLHAYKLTFVDPIGSMSYLKGKTFTSQLPEQLEKIQKELFS